MLIVPETDVVVGLAPELDDVALVPQPTVAAARIATAGIAARRRSPSLTFMLIVLT
jgi:hypothetical protein